MKPGAMIGPVAPRRSATPATSMLTISCANSIVPRHAPYGSNNVPLSLRITAVGPPARDFRTRYLVPGVQYPKHTIPSGERMWSMARTTYYPEPKVSQFLFASKYMAPFWTVVRVYLGWLWLNAGWHKVTDPRWVGS